MNANKITVMNTNINMSLITNFRYYASINSPINSSNPFSSPIPSHYVHDKTRTGSVYFNLTELVDVTHYANKVYCLLPHDLYTTYVKIRYNNDPHAMCGNQFGFDYNSIDDIDKLFSIVSDKINQSFEGCGLSDDDIV